MAKIEKIALRILATNIVRNNANGLSTQQRIRLIEDVSKALEERQYHNCATFKDVENAAKAQAEEMKLKSR